VNNMPTSNDTHDDSKMNSAVLYVALSPGVWSSVEYGSLGSSVPRSSAQCSAKGDVWNTDSIFDGKRCDVHFCRNQINPEFVRAYGLRLACGSIKVAARLEPERLAGDREEILINPIQITILPKDDVYDRLESLLHATNDRKASLCLHFTHRDFVPFMPVHRIDISAEAIYPVLHFHVTVVETVGAIAKWSKS
jgi:hypothetical protein